MAALEIATGEVTGACYPQHRHQEFLAFLNQLVKAYPRRPLHVVLDNSSTHSTPEVGRWLQRHKRVHFHFTPTGASWMNMVETWFSILTNQHVRRGSYHDVPELIAAIEHFIDHYNQRAQPFLWTKTPDRILAKALKQQPTSAISNRAQTPSASDDEAESKISDSFLDDATSSGSSGAALGCRWDVAAAAVSPSGRLRGARRPWDPHLARVVVRAADIA